MLPSVVQGWRKTSVSPPCKASPQGGGFCLRAGCPGSFPPPSLAELSGKEEPPAPRGAGEHIPRAPRGAASAPRNSGCLHSSQRSGRAPPFPAGPGSSPGATSGWWRRRTLCREVRVPWCTSGGVTQPVASRGGTAWEGLGGTQLAPGDSPQPSPRLPGFPLAPIPVPPTAPQPGEPRVSPAPSPAGARGLHPGCSGWSRG